MKKTVCLLLALAMLLSLTACGGSASYGVNVLETLVEQEYSLAFRTNDVLYYYITGAIEQLAFNGTVDELSRKWFGTEAVSFPKKNGALESLAVPENKTLIIGIDTDSFPLAYNMDGVYWGFDIELATEVCTLLGWTLQTQVISKEDVYVELSAGNIDVAWGGVALDAKEVEKGRYTQYGPYMENDIVIAARQRTGVWNPLKLNGRNMAMPSTVEAMAALETDAKLPKRLGQITRLAGGTLQCFEYLYAGKCDAVLTDTAALMYYNTH